MIDKPLYGNPLAGGLSFRQEGDMGRYVADNDPGGIAAGFSNLEDYLAAGNKLPEQQTPNDLLGVSNANFNVSPPGTLNVTPPSVPVSAQTPLPSIVDNFRPKSDDPLVQGYMDSDFYSNIATTNVVPYTYKGKEMSGSGSYASNFKKYLESIGKGDLIQFPDQGIAQQGSGPLATVGPNVGNEIVPYNPDAGPGVGLDGKPLLDGTANPYQEQFTGFQNQLTGFGDQFSGLNDRLNKIEEGIASLLGNRGQGFNMGFQPNYGFNYSGIESFYPPFGGMYG